MMALVVTVLVSLTRKILDGYSFGEPYPEVTWWHCCLGSQKRNTKLVSLTRKFFRAYCLGISKNVLHLPGSYLGPYGFGFWESLVQESLTRKLITGNPRGTHRTAGKALGTPAPEWAPAGFPAHKTLNQPTGDAGCLVSFQGFGVGGWGWVDQTATRWSPAQIPEQGLNLNRS